MGEHVHHTRTYKPIAIAYQNIGISRQRGGVAGNVNDSAGTKSRQIFTDFLRNGTGRVDQDFIKTFFGPALAGKICVQICPVKLNISQAIQAGILTAPNDHGIVTLHANNLATFSSQRQGKVTQPAEQIQYTLTGLHLQPFNRPTYHSMVNIRIDLSEVHGMKAHGEIKFRQPVTQPLMTAICRFRPDTVYSIRTFWLQIDMQVVGLPEGNQLLSVATAQLIHIAKHHGRVIIATGNFNLRYTRVCIQFVQQGTQRHNPLTYAGVQHHATIYIREKGIPFFSKTNQNGFPCSHIANTQPGFPAVSKSVLCAHGGYPLFRLNASKVSKMIPQCVLFELNLGLAFHMLKAASATQVCKLTGWCLAIRCRPQHVQRAQLIKFTVADHHLSHHGFARQSPIYKLRLAVLVCNAPAIVTERFDLTMHWLFGYGRSASSAHTTYSY